MAISDSISYFFGRSKLHNDKFSVLRPALILSTIGRLEERIAVRFPESGLLRVCREFRELATESEALARHLAPPI